MSQWQKCALASMKDLLTRLGQRDPSTNRDGFDEEFDVLTKVDQQVRSNPDEFYTASLPSNMAKNRYPYILPNEGTRVILEPLTERGDGTFINANYIDARRLFGVPFVYIATQAPISATISDYWRMIWENNCSFIVMLCAEVENGKSKSVRYFPDFVGGILNLGYLTLITESENRRDDTIFRTFILRHEDGREHKVFHMQYTTWPDQGIPKTPAAIMDIIYTIGKSQLSTKSLIAVHCSGGVGRTGVFIAMHVVLALFQLERPISVPRVVQYLKYCRTGMVQRKDQYIFLYFALLREMERMIWAFEHKGRVSITDTSTNKLKKQLEAYTLKRPMNYTPIHPAQSVRPEVKRVFSVPQESFDPSSPFNRRHLSVLNKRDSINDIENEQLKELEAIYARGVGYPNVKVMEEVPYRGPIDKSIKDLKKEYVVKLTGVAPVNAPEKETADMEKPKDDYVSNQTINLSESVLTPSITRVSPSRVHTSKGPLTTIDEELLRIQNENAKKRATQSSPASSYRGARPADFVRNQSILRQTPKSGPYNLNTSRGNEGPSLYNKSSFFNSDNTDNNSNLSIREQLNFNVDNILQRQNEGAKNSLRQTSYRDDNSFELKNLEKLNIPGNFNAYQHNIKQDQINYNSDNSRFYNNPISSSLPLNFSEVPYHTSQQMPEQHQSQFRQQQLNQEIQPLEAQQQPSLSNESTYQDFKKPVTTSDEYQNISNQQKTLDEIISPQEYNLEQKKQNKEELLESTVNFDVAAKLLTDKNNLDQQYNIQPADNRSSSKFVMPSRSAPRVSIQEGQGDYSTSTYSGIRHTSVSQPNVPSSAIRTSLLRAAEQPHASPRALRSTLARQIQSKNSEASRQLSKSPSKLAVRARENTLSTSSAAGKVPQKYFVKTEDLSPNTTQKSMAERSSNLPDENGSIKKSDYGLL